MERHQRGYIFEANGAFHVRHYVKEIVDGQIIRKQRSHRLCSKDRSTGHGSTTAKAVVQLCEDFMRTINSDLAPTNTLKIVDFWKAVYLPFITENLKPSTIGGYTQIWNQHLEKHFSEMLLREYRTPMCSLFLTKLAKTLRPRTLQHIKFLMSALFSHAVATGNCENNPIRDAMVLGKTKANGETQAYTLEEIEDVISALVDRVDCQLIMALSFFCGLRKGEIQGLQWSDVDDDFIHVRRAFSRGVIGTPKTKKSIRTIPIIAPVRIPLLLWKNKCTDGVWLFPISLVHLSRKVIRPTLKKNNLPWKGYHAGRRGLGTTLRALTGNSNAGKNILGHSSEQITQQHYEAAMPAEALAGMKLLEAKIVKQ